MNHLEYILFKVSLSSLYFAVKNDITKYQMIIPQSTRYPGIKIFVIVSKICGSKNDFHFM